MRRTGLFTHEVRISRMARHGAIGGPDESEKLHRHLDEIQSDGRRYVIYCHDEQRQGTGDINVVEERAVVLLDRPENAEVGELVAGREAVELTAVLIRTERDGAAHVELREFAPRSIRIGPGARSVRAYERVK